MLSRSSGCPECRTSNSCWQSEELLHHSFHTKNPPGQRKQTGKLMLYDVSSLYRCNCVP
jgi:hypothetical protein